MTNVLKKKNLVFHTTEKEHLTADLYLPTTGQDFPVIVMIHGGAYQAGSKEMYDDWGTLLAENGFAALSINYRLATRDYPSYPGLLDDVRAALHFIVAHANEWSLDPLKISLMGDSAGGYLSTMMALEEGYSSYKIKSVVSVYGVLDLHEWADYTNATRDDYVINKMFGFDPFIGRDAYAKASPMNLIADVPHYLRFDTEFMMIWGEADEVVLPENQSVKFSQKLTDLGIKQEKIIIPDRGHFWFTKNNPGQVDSSLLEYPNPLVVPQVLAFLERTLTAEQAMDPTV